MTLIDSAPATSGSRRARRARGAPVPEANRTRRRAGLVLGYGLLGLLAFTVLYPFFYSINTALKTPVEFAERSFGLVHHPTLQNLSDTWAAAGLLTGLRNSLIVAVASILLLWVMGAMAGFAVSKMEFRGRLPLFLVVLASGLIPFQTIVSPLYVELSRLGLLDQYLGLVLVYAASGLPITTFLFAAYFKGIPSSIIEAARMDGASRLRILWHVVLPISKPALAITGIVNFVNIFNDLLVPLIVLQSPEKQTFVVNIALSHGRYLEAPQQAAAVVFGLLPLVVVFLFAQRFLVRGVTAGAIR